MTAAVLLFRSKAEVDRDALIAHARACYDSVFPKDDPAPGCDSPIQDHTRYPDPPLAEYVASAGYSAGPDDLTMDHADAFEPEPEPEPGSLYMAADNDPA